MSYSTQQYSMDTDGTLTCTLTGTPQLIVVALSLLRRVLNKLIIEIILPKMQQRQ